MPVATMQSDWREEIANAARPALERDVGAVIVGLSPKGQAFLSRVYLLADYANSRKLRAVVWSRITRCFNDDTEGGNYYAVHRYEDGSIIVYNGPDSILWDAA